MSDCCSTERLVRVEVRRLGVDGETCERCGATYEAATSAIADAQTALAGAGAVVELSERVLGADEIAESNRVYVNDRPAEDWLGGTIGYTDCPSCADLLGESTCCRSYEIDGAASDALSADDIARAIRLAAGLGEAGDIAAAALRVTLVTSSACG